MKPVVVTAGFAMVFVTIFVPPENLIECRAARKLLKDAVMPLYKYTSCIWVSY